MAKTLITLAAESGSHESAGAMPYLIGGTALVVLLALLFVVASYRDVANRHRSKAAAYAARHGGGEHGGH